QLNIHGQIINSRWLTGLSAPRGLCIANDALYVADSEHVLKVNLQTARVLDTIQAPEIHSLTDLEVSSEGLIYVTDAASNSIYTIQNDELKLWKSDAALQNPTGLYLAEDQMLVTSANGHKLMAIDLKSRQTKQIADSLQMARGITKIGQDLIVGGLAGQLYGVKQSMDFRWPLVDLQAQKDDVADILYVKEYDVLFIPTFKGNSVLAVSVIQ
ncbi:MAG: hypothetical protein AAFO69_13335, partial [Bacteroidota bacterium]